MLWRGLATSVSRRLTRVVVGVAVRARSVMDGGDPRGWLEIAARSQA